MTMMLMSSISILHLCLTSVISRSWMLMVVSVTTGPTIVKVCVSPPCRSCTVVCWMPVMAVVCCRWSKSTSVKSWSQHCSRDKSGGPSSHTKLKTSCLHLKHTSSFSRVSADSCMMVPCHLEWELYISSYWFLTVSYYWEVIIYFFIVLLTSIIVPCRNTLQWSSCTVCTCRNDACLSHSNKYLTCLRCSTQYWQCGVPPSGHSSGVGQVEDCWGMHYQCTLSWSCSGSRGACHTMVPADRTGMCVYLVGVLYGAIWATVNYILQAEWRLAIPSMSAVVLNNNQTPFCNNGFTGVGRRQSDA